MWSDCWVGITCVHRHTHNQYLIRPILKLFWHRDAWFFVQKSCAAPIKDACANKHVLYLYRQQFCKLYDINLHGVVVVYWIFLKWKFTAYSLWSTPKSVFCNAILYIINIGKTHFTLKDCKNRPSYFFLKGGGGGTGMRKEKKMVEFFFHKLLRWLLKHSKIRIL